MEQKQTVYLTTKDLMERWKCSYKAANEFMHRKTSNAIKPKRKLLVDERKVIAYENACRVS